MIRLFFQVSIFTVLAMVLQRKPDVALGLLPLMKEPPKYQGQDKLLVAVWLIAQVCVRVKFSCILYMYV